MSTVTKGKNMQTINAMNVKITDIFVDFAANARVVYDESRQKELADTIKRDGLLHPLTVRRSVEKTDKTDRPFVLISGYRRYKALTEILKVESVDVRLVDTTPQEADFASMNENLAREDLSQYEKTKGLIRMRDQYKIGGAEMARRLAGADMQKSGGHKPTTLNNLMRIWDNLDSRIAKCWAARDPNATTHNLIVVIGDGASKSEQWDKWQAIVNPNAGKEDKDGKDDKDEDEDDKEEKDTPRPSRAKLALALAAIEGSEHSKEWKEGAMVALGWAMGARKTIPGISLKKAKKADKDAA